jgi:uncharacterized protein
MVRHLEVRLLEGRFALARLQGGSAMPNQPHKLFAAIIHSDEGTSMVCPESAVPAGAESRGGFRCFEVVGAFDLESVGVVAAIAQPLAEAGVSLFAYSTWQTDYVLVHQTDLDTALAALRKAGHRVGEGERR